MNRIFLAPVSTVDRNSNYTHTISKPISKKTLNSSIEIGIEKVYVWGIWNKNVTWSRINKGDLVFFYFKGNIITIGEVYLTLRDKEISKKLWGSFKDKDTNEVFWEYLIIFNNIIDDINIPFDILRTSAGYKSNASVRFFMEYKMTGIEKIIKDFSSVEKFIEAHKI